MQKSRQFYPIFFLLSLLLCTTSCSTVKPKKLSKALHKQFRESPVFDKYFMGFSLYDPASGSTIYEANSDKYFTPASNTKLFTFYASIKYLGDSIEGLKYVERGDSLVFWGTGDPSFLHPDLYQSKKVFNFLKNQPGILVFSDQNYFNPRFGAGWAWDDYSYYYSAETASFPIYGNIVRFSSGPFNTLRVSPKMFSDSAYHRPASNHRKSGITRAEHSNKFYFHPNRLPADTTTIPLKYSVPTFIRLLQDTLARRVNYQPLPIDSASKTLYSIPTDSVYKIMLQESDNFLAEQLLLLVGAAINDSLDTKKIITYLQDSLLNDLPDKPIWVDGSGLSRYNLFTPRTMVKLLENIYHAVPEDRLFQLMPAGGVNGTISSWYGGKETYIYAKTGTLSNNHCLSGYLVTRKGKKLIFSFMHNNYPFGSSVTKKAMAPILTFIRDNY